jgi:hypothetical protein
VARRPHLEHRVEAAVVEAGPLGVLVDLDDLDLDAELLLEDDRGHVGVGVRARPGVRDEADALTAGVTPVVTPEVAGI